MNTAEKWVTTTDALIAAIKDESIERVVMVPSGMRLEFSMAYSRVT
jgi:hypothetical protein